VRRPCRRFSTAARAGCRTLGAVASRKGCGFRRSASPSRNVPASNRFWPSSRGAPCATKDLLLAQPPPPKHLRSFPAPTSSRAAPAIFAFRPSCPSLALTRV
jgi:hypothetical protein